VRTWVAMAVTVVGITLVAACGDDPPADEDVDASAAGAVLGSGAPAAVATECRIDTTPTGTDEPEEGAPPPGQGDRIELPDLPPPTIPAEASPPTTEPGSDPIDSDPVDILDPDGPGIPALGGFRVDPPEHGCVDIAVHLEQYGRFRLKSWGDDGIYTQVQVFSPSGEKIASWDTGEPQTYEGYTWEDEGGLPETGTYVIRVVHVGGSHDSYVIIAYGDPPA
jgi:hypothetical protein